ncbi:MAG: methyl-accepting chemotaxis protein [Fibrobacteria bacterium]
MAESNVPNRVRHPIRNFIIMPEVQWPYIIRLLAMVNIAGVLMAMSICALFYFSLSGDPSGVEGASGLALDPLVEDKLMEIVVPAFVIGDLVSLAIGLWLSLYFSRKISVPIYRITKWAEAVSGGELRARLHFRPGDELQKLETACNEVTETYCKIIEDLRRRITEANLPLPPGLERFAAAQAQEQTKAQTQAQKREAAPAPRAL